MMDQRGVLNTRIHHVLRILLTAPRHRQPQTQPTGGYQTFPSATIGRSSEEFRTKVARTSLAIAQSSWHSSLAGLRQQGSIGRHAVVNVAAVPGSLGRSKRP